MPVKNVIPGQHVTKEKLQRSRELRREMTPAEKLLWQEVRANKLGVRFRRQQVIQGFIVDFYCHQAGLVIEEMEMSTIYRKRKMNGEKRCCPRWD
jgi:very-short-patch-repair endonuclease